MINKKYTAFSLALLLLFSGCSLFAPTTPKPELQKYQASFLFLFDTVTYVMGYAESEPAFTETAGTFRKELEEYHQLYDIYNEYPGINNIRTINQNAGIAPVKVDQRIIDLLEVGKQAYTDTDGLTNMAMGSVLLIWHNYRERGIDEPEAAELPPMEKLQEAAKHINIEDVVIDRAASTVFLKDPEMRLDVGSIGKGYAVERVVQLMEARGIDHFLISVGGNIRAIGKKPDGKLWDAGIENPYGGTEFVEVVQMENQSLVTSGTYQRYYTVDGIRYHHIIDPETLMPLHNMTAVAVLCNDSGLADCYSTALFNMTVEQGQKWVAEHDGIEAMWMLDDESVIFSAGFERHLKGK